MQLSFEYDRHYFPAFPILEFTVAGAEPSQQQSLSGLIDSGSDVTQIPLPILKKIGARDIDDRWVRDVSGLRYPVTMFMVQLQIGTLILPGMQVVGRTGLTEVIIGRDVLNQLIVTLNGLAHIMVPRYSIP